MTFLFRTAKVLQMKTSEPSDGGTTPIVEEQWLREKAAIEDESFLSVGGLISELGTQNDEDVNQEQYEKDLAQRQAEHLSKVTARQVIARRWRPCLHDKCPECHGTGIKLDGTPCIHAISCPCPKCNPFKY